MPFWLKFIVTFVAIFTTDICWAFYVTKVKEGNPTMAAKWAVLLYITGAAGTLGIVSDPWLLLPACLAAYSGTYVAVWHDNKSKK